MGDIGALLEALWRDFARLNPQARRIHELLSARGERVVNDHLALRTFGDPRVGIHALARPFLEAGYRSADAYRFPDKKLRARHFEPPAEGLPLLFVSELETERFSETFRAIVGRLLEQVPADLPGRQDFPVSGRPWSLTRAEYERLRSESEYAAHVAAFGFRANHFTVRVNELRTFSGIAELNEFLKREGFRLNERGGEIKGSPADLLEQSATLAEEVEVSFADGPLRIPDGYYEFARRYPGPDGRLYLGFVERSADRIFESTDRR